MDANGAGGGNIGKELAIKKKTTQTKNKTKHKTSNNSMENKML